MGNKSDSELRVQVLTDIDDERNRQNQKWGRQRHSNETWFVISQEEGGEQAEAIQGIRGMASEKPTDAKHLYMEIIQQAAVLTAWAEQLLEEELDSYGQDTI